MYVFTPNGRSLHFRATRSTTEDNIIQEIPYGSKVYVEDWDGTWARIQFNGSSGYVVKRFLQIGRPASFEEVKAAEAQAKEDRAAAAAQKAAEEKALAELRARQRKLDAAAPKVVQAYDATVLLDYEEATAALYKKTSLLSDIIQYFPDGTRLTVTAENKDWAKVYIGSFDLEGYMLKADLVSDLVEEEILEDD